MSQRRIYTAAAPIEFPAIRAELGIPEDFPEAVVKEATESAAQGPWLEPDRPDHTGLPLVTLDPPGSRDLDQAVHVTRSADGLGYVVTYAIADVGALVRPGGLVEAESLRRGATLYSPDRSSPLHPRVLSEGAGSLLPDERRPAVLWTIELDSAGLPQRVEVERAWVRSVARLDYPSAQVDADLGVLHPSIALLPQVGKLRQVLARQRHAINLDLPDVQVSRGRSGGWDLELRAALDIEQYNAEISLLTGMCAAQLMLGGGIGILRTLPDPSGEQVEALRRTTAALGMPWRRGVPPGDVIAQLDARDPLQAAFLEQAARLLRGAGYTAFHEVPPERPEHAGVGAPYAHVTAPLRRLVDRFGTEICLALGAGSPVADWVRARLDDLPKLMSTADQRANTLEKACIGAVGAFLLHGREGAEFSATVLTVDRERQQATVVLDQPPVRAKCSSDQLREGDRVTVVLESADPTGHHYAVRLAGSAPASADADPAPST